MKAEQCLVIPEKREAVVPVEADATRFAVWRVARERWGPAFRYRSPRADTLFCGLVLSGTLEQSDGGPNTVEVRAGEVVLCGAGGPRSHIVRDPEGVELLMWVALSGLAADMARSLFPSLPTAFAVGRVRAMESLFIRLLEEAERATPETSRICGCLGEALLLQAARASREQSVPRSRRGAAAKRRADRGGGGARPGVGRPLRFLTLLQAGHGHAAIPDAPAPPSDRQSHRRPQALVERSAFVCVHFDMAS